MENNKSTINNPVSALQVNVPDNLPVVYTDSIFVHSNKYGLVIDFAQTVGTTNRQNVISRVGMSKTHAKALLEVLQKNLENTRKKEKNNKPTDKLN